MSCWARTPGPAQELDKHNSAALPKRQFSSAPKGGGRPQRGEARTICVTARQARGPTIGPSRARQRAQAITTPPRKTTPRRAVCEFTGLNSVPAPIARLIGKEGRRVRVCSDRRSHRKDIEEDRDGRDPAADPRKPASRPIKMPVPGNKAQTRGGSAENSAATGLPSVVIAWAPTGEQTPGQSERSFRGQRWRDEGRNISAPWRCRKSTVSTNGRSSASCRPRSKASSRRCGPSSSRAVNPIRPTA